MQNLKEHYTLEQVVAACDGRSEPDEETQTRFGFDLQLVITLIDLYANV